MNKINVPILYVQFTVAVQYIFAEWIDASKSVSSLFDVCYQTHWLAHLDTILCHFARSDLTLVRVFTQLSNFIWSTARTLNILRKCARLGSEKPNNNSQCLNIFQGKCQHQASESETMDLAMRICKSWKHKEALKTSKHQHLALKWFNTHIQTAPYLWRPGMQRCRFAPKQTHLLNITLTLGLL